jgi:coproporphyrinogen III oxidase-like Fe-S oxidoreductase
LREISSASTYNSLESASKLAYPILRMDGIAVGIDAFARCTEVLLNNPGNWISRLVTHAIRRHLVGPDQRWAFEPPSRSWTPPRIERTSLYLHVPFCRNTCPYCPYTKVPYDEMLVAPYTRAALAEVDWWADKIGPAEVTSVYIGGGTPTLALGSIATILARVRKRFRLTGDICIETSPTDITEITVHQLQHVGVALVSLGVQSFNQKNLALMGRRYKPSVAERALTLLAEGDFASVNVDMMFALPGQTENDVVADLARSVQLGANQLTTYPLFTFPYTSVGEFLHLTALRMPNLGVRRTHYRAIGQWCAEHGFERVSVWCFKRDNIPRYSSVTRDGYIGIGPGSGSHLPDGFALNTFDLNDWIQAACTGRTAIALRMPFVDNMSGWWWLYWRFYDTRIPLHDLELVLGNDAPKARRWLRAMEQLGLMVRNGEYLKLTEPGAFWLHLAQNHFALTYVNTLWTRARREPWPQAVAI